MTREHIFFIPTLLALGFIAGALATQRRQAVTGDANAQARPSSRGVVFGLVAMVLVFAATHVFSMHGGVKHLGDMLQGQQIFDQRPSFTAEEVYARLEAFGAHGRAAYRRMTFTSDLVFPLALCHFLFQLALFVVRIAPRSPRLTTWAKCVPFVWLFADLAENASVFYLITAFPRRHDVVAGYLGFLTDVKFALLVLSLVLPAVVLWRASRRKALSALVAAN